MVIKRFAVRLETRTSRVTRRDYDFEQPRLSLESAITSAFAPDLEDYDYPGRFTDRTRGRHLARRALERHRADYRLAEGASDQPILRSGHFLAISEHPRREWNDLWLLREIEHQGRQPQVLESWAGDRYGGIAIPRVGMEVLVSFLEGDPDQPLVTGCLYHKEHVVPYDLPANKTRSVFKTLSSPGGGGYNELRIEDRKGAKQIYLHAQRDWDQNIEHDQKLRVGHQRHDTVEANSYSEFKAEEHLTVHGDRKVEIKPDDHLTVGQSQHIKIGTAQLIEAGQEIHLKAGQKMLIEAGMELTLKAGGSFIKLDPSGVTVVGPQVRVNAGGSLGAGSGIGIKAPRLPGRRIGIRRGK